MRNTSLIVLAAAIVLGIIAVFGVQALMNARSGGAGASVELTTIVVARKALEFGDELSADTLEAKQWPATALPEGAFTSVEEVIGSERRVALRSIAVGEPVLKDKVSGFGGRASLSQVIEPGFRAVAVRVSDVSGAGGFILPGDRVDVVNTVSPTNEKVDTVTNILLPDVRVLAIDQEADESKGGAIVAKAATLEVTAEGAQKIALASTIGTLSLALRTMTNATDPAVEEKPTKVIRYKDLGVTPQDEKKESAARTGPARSPYATMNVTRGVEQSRASVPIEGSRRQSSIGAAASGMRNATAAGAGRVATTVEAVTPGSND